MRVMLALVLVFCFFCGGLVPSRAQPASGHPGLGVLARDLPQDVPLHGAWVQRVVTGSAAEAAGLRPNDVIVAVDGQPVQGALALRSATADLGPGSRVTIQLLRPAGGSAQRLVLTAILAGSTTSPQVTGTAAASLSPAASAPVAWTRFVDPIEHGFSLEVPARWRVQGGMVRHSAVGVVPYVRVLSPDASTYLMLGDPGLTYFATPSFSSFAPHRRERTQFVAPSGDMETVLRYLPGAAYAADYARESMARLCADLRLGPEITRPDLAEGPWARTNPTARHDGGAVTFTCSHGGKDAHGAVAADTYIYPSPARGLGSFWAVDFLVGSIAPPDRVATATAMLTHMVQTLRIDPAWQQQQQQVIDAVARRAVIMTQQQIQQFQQVLADQQTRIHAMDRQFESFDRVITGTSPYVDSSGTVHQMLDNTRQNQWLLPNGTTLGANSSAPPVVGAQRMQEVPPQ